MIHFTFYINFSSEYWARRSKLWLSVLLCLMAVWIFRKWVGVFSRWGHYKHFHIQFRNSGSPSMDIMKFKELINSKYSDRIQNVSTGLFVNASLPTEFNSECPRDLNVVPRRSHCKRARIHRRSRVNSWSHFEYHKVIPFCTLLSPKAFRRFWTFFHWKPNHRELFVATRSPLLAVRIIVMSIVSLLLL